MAKKKSQSKGERSPEQLVKFLLERMENCEDAEALNDNVIIPFTAALETVCGARGYLLNIYGDKSNLAITSDEDAEAIYALIEDYLDSRRGE